jgi:hypothetical protein
LRGHCVSRPTNQQSQHFFNEHHDFQPHYVSRYVPVNFPAWIDRHGRRVSFDLLAAQLASKPTLPVVVGVEPVPGPAGPSVTLSLAGRRTADSLPKSHPRVWPKPLVTDPTGAFLRHALTLLQSEKKGEGMRGQKWREKRIPGGGYRSTGGSFLMSRGGSILDSAEGRSSAIVSTP